MIDNGPPLTYQALRRRRVLAAVCRFSNRSPLVRVEPMKTFSLKAADVDKKWVVIDASGLVVGLVHFF